MRRRALTLAALALGGRAGAQDDPHAPRSIAATYADAPGRGTGTPTLHLQWGHACEAARARDDVRVTNPGGVREGFALCVRHTPRRAMAFSSAVVHVVAEVYTAPRDGVDCATPGASSLLREPPTVARGRSRPELDADGVLVARVEPEAAGAPADAVREDEALARAVARWRGEGRGDVADARAVIVRSELLEWRDAHDGPQLTVLTLGDEGLPRGYWSRCVARWGILVTAYRTAPLLRREHHATKAPRRSGPPRGARRT